MKPRTVIGVLFVVASLLKIGTLWGILHWSWFETMSEGPWVMYFSAIVKTRTSGYSDRCLSVRTASVSAVRFTMVATSTSIAARPSTVPGSTLSAAASDWICVRP